MPNTVIDWTVPGNVKTLHNLWNAGVAAAGISIAIIGNASGKSAVIGKARREKLPARDPVASNPKTRTAFNAAVRAQKGINPRSQSVSAARDKLNKIAQLPTALTSSNWTLPEGAKTLTLVELTQHTCRWPYDNPNGRGYVYCGQHTTAIPGKKPTDPMRDSPYCQHHHDLAIAKEQP